MIKTKIILDSLNPITKKRITTFESQMHRFILSEFNTHRVFSRNSASSRAIPISKRIKSAMDDPAIPIYWGKNQSGMQANTELSSEEIQKCKTEWLNARDNAVKTVLNLKDLNLHKQLSNRILEPFLWHTVVFTTTEIENFFSQRLHPDAQPEMKVLADTIQKAYQNSIPIERTYHIPYIDYDYQKIHKYYNHTLFKIGVARCARVSYYSHDDNKIDIEKDIQLFEKLNNSVPPHLSPFEHVAIAHIKPDKFFNFNDWFSLRYLKEKTDFSF